MVEAQFLAEWLTPTSLFVLLNIVLATIFLSKNNNNNNHQNAAVSSTATQPQSHPHHQPIRAPSLFSRVASFNFSHYYHSDDSHVPPQPDAAASVVTPPVVNTVARAPSLLFRVASFKFGWTPNPSKQEDGKGKVVISGQKEKAHDVVSEGENEEEAVKIVKKVVRKKKVKKEGVVADAAKVEEKTTAFRREDEEVDSKADDFINKFKQQLKMQRLESLLRYRNNATPV